MHWGKNMNRAFTNPNCPTKVSEGCKARGCTTRQEHMNCAFADQTASPPRRVRAHASPCREVSPAVHAFTAATALDVCTAPMLLAQPRTCIPSPDCTALTLPPPPRSPAPRTCALICGVPSSDGHSAPLTLAPPCRTSTLVWERSSPSPKSTTQTEYSSRQLSAR